jgi:DNA-binding winged helix-turn-helix (wHTH) protein
VANIFVTDDNITQCVHDVRCALGRESGHLLQTVPRRGYIFEAEVVRQEPGPSVSRAKSRQAFSTISCRSANDLGRRGIGAPWVVRSASFPESRTKASNR